MVRVRTIFVAVTTATMLGASGFMLFLATTSGAAKDCTITGTAANDNITGTTRDDVICLRAGSDTANGLEGDDVIRGGQGDDGPDFTITASPSNFGGVGGILGGGGSDVIKGGPDDDNMQGEGQNDTVVGGQGDDNALGNDGNDTIKTRDHVSGNDTAAGGANTDKCVVDAQDATDGCEQ